MKILPLKFSKQTDWILISAGVLFGLVLLIIGVATAIKSIADWGASYQFIGQRVVDLSVRLPYRIEIRKPEVVVNPLVESVGIDNLSDIETYICNKWGVYDCKLALAVARAESGMNCNAIHVNSNGSVDMSIMQVNSLWIKTYSLKDIADCNKNVDIAYEIWDRADGVAGDKKGNFSAWAVVNNGSVAREFAK